MLKQKHCYFVVILLVLMVVLCPSLQKITLKIAMGTTILSFFLGLCSAYIITKGFIPKIKIFNYIYLLPLLIPPYVHAVVWMNNFKYRGIFGAIFVYTGYLFPIVAFCYLNFKYKRKYFHPLVALTPLIYIFMYIYSEPIVPEVMNIKSYPSFIVAQYLRRDSAQILTTSLYPLSLSFALGLLLLSSLKTIDLTPQCHLIPLTKRSFKIAGTCFIILLTVIFFFYPFLIMIRETKIEDFLFEIGANKTAIVLNILIAFASALGTYLISLTFLNIITKENFLAQFLNYLLAVMLLVPTPLIAISLAKVFQPIFKISVVWTLIVTVLSYQIKYSSLGVRVLTWQREKKKVKLICLFILFLFCYQELSLGLVLLPREYATLAIKLEILIDYEIRNGVLTLALIQLLITILMLGFFSKFMYNIRSN